MADLAVTTLTDYRVFEPRYLCTGCGLDLNEFDENTPPSGCKHDLFEAENCRHYLPNRPDDHGIPAISCLRAPGHESADRMAGGALVDIPQRYVYHSPDGFEWGYGGSGPSDLALNILALFVPAPEAWRLHHDYTWDVIAKLPREGGVITAQSVRRWIDKQWAAGHAKITIESTEQILEFSVRGPGGVPGPVGQGRLWTGLTERGVPVQLLVVRVAVANDPPANLRQFEEELQETPAPAPPVVDFPLRMVL